MQLIADNVALVLLGAMLLLVVAGGVRFVAARRTRQAGDRQRLGSVVVWWVIVGLLVLVAASESIGREFREYLPETGKIAAVCVTAAVSLLAFREFVRLTEPTRHYGGIEWLGYAAVPLHYGCVGWAEPPWMFVAAPVALFAFATAWSIVRGRTAGYLAAQSGLFWGVVVTVFGLSHAALLWRLPQSANPVADGGVGWLVFLVLLTQSNDIAQALWGRAVGRRRITPVVSPNKTWEGFLLGAATTLGLAVLLSIPLTPWIEFGDFSAIGITRAIAAGLIVALGGFFGDLNMSALKRDLGVKDSGNVLPGQGGVLDRIDSLTFTAPLFFYYLCALYGIDSP